MSHPQKLTLLAVVLVVFGVTMRLVPHVANFSPILAIALLSGVAFKSKYSWLLPLSIMVISDAIIGFHHLSLLIWACYVAVAYLASLPAKTTSLRRPLIMALSGSVSFFLITNLGVWLEGRMYAMSLRGLIDCYEAALPFFRNSLVSDIIYTSLLFSLYAYAIRPREVVKSSLTVRT